MTASASPGAVERPVTVGVTGAHSTGKSTFLARLAHALRRRGYEVATVADLGEKAQQIGFPILHNHTFASTLWIMSRGISNEVATWPHADVLLVDRAVPDALGYYRAALAFRDEPGEPAELDYLHALARQHAGCYDLVLRTALGPAIPTAERRNRRDHREDFRRLADEHVRAVLHHLGIPHTVLRADDHDHALIAALNAVEHALDRRAQDPDAGSGPDRGAETDEGSEPGGSATSRGPSTSTATTNATPNAGYALGPIRSVLENSPARERAALSPAGDRDPEGADRSPRRPSGHTHTSPYDHQPDGPPTIREPPAAHPPNRVRPDRARPSDEVGGCEA